MLDLMFCCCLLETLNNSWKRSSVFSFCNSPCKLCTLFEGGSLLASLQGWLQPPTPQLCYQRRVCYEKANLPLNSFKHMSFISKLVWRRNPTRLLILCPQASDKHLLGKVQGTVAVWWHSHTPTVRPHWCSLERRTLPQQVLASSSIPVAGGRVQTLSNQL